MNPTAQQLAIVHGFGCEGEGAGQYCSVAVLNIVRGE